jgi:predicted Zn-dependent peptidase
VTTINFQSLRLANGLTIVGERNPNARSLAVGFLARTGSRDETPEIAGVSHFLEHMVFKGSEDWTAWDINREFDEIGARYNAFTSEEVTAYHGAVLPEHQDRLLGTLGQLMQPALRQEDFDVEKQVILEEIKMYEDRPTFKVFDEARPAFFRDHPLGHSVLGSTESITRLRRDQMHAYFAARYAPDNLLVAATGNYDWDRLVAGVEAIAGRWKPAGATRSYPPFRAQGSTRVVISEKLNREHIALMAPGFPAQSPERYPAGLLATIVGDGDGSRLYWRLVHPGLADAAELGHDAEDRLGHFNGYVSADPERAAEALDATREVLLEAQSGGVTDAELERAKRKLAVSLVLRAETPYGRLFPLGLEYLDNGEYRSLQESVAAIQAVTLDEVNAVLETRPFDDLTVVALGPLDSLS